MKSLDKPAPSPPHIDIAHSSYQPTKADKEETLKFTENTTPEDLARALTQPVKVRYFDPRKQW